MPKNITQYELLISCPGDIKQEVKIIKDVVHKFNSEFSRTLGIMIQERYWETDSYPSSGNTPQKILNKQFINDCDAVVAILWTRFGTPTDEYGSGTEEEIENMIAANKQVFMYFSGVPVSFNEVNNEQYKKIKEFKSKYTDRGVYWEYKTTDEFKDLFYAHITKYFLSLSKVEEINNSKKPDIEVELIDASTENKHEGPYEFKYPYGLITYKKLTEEDIFDDIADYVTVDDINKYNEELPTEDEVSTFNEQQKLYENSQNNCYDFKLLISNIGSIKANEIYIDLYFPKEILVYNADDAKNIRKPDRIPNMPDNPISKALNEIEKKERKKMFGGLANLMERDRLIRLSLNDIEVNSIVSTYHSSPILSYTRLIPSSYDYSVRNNQELSVNIDSLLHTRRYISDKFSLIFTTYGEFKIEYSVMCEEWEEPIKGYFQIKVN